MEIQISFKVNGKHFVGGRRKDNRDFVKMARGVIEQAKEEESYSRAANYGTALRSFLRFYRASPLCICDITEEVITNYQRWLQHHDICMNTISCYMRSLRSIYNKVVEKTAEASPFDKVFTGKTPTEKRAITVDDIKRIQSLHFPERSHLSFYRDIFLFSVFTMGMPFVDIAHLRKTSISDGVISYRRRKTGQSIKVAVEPCIWQIIERYSVAGSAYVFPILTDGDENISGSDTFLQYKSKLRAYNYALKRIGEMAGVSRRLTSYVGRHTWASIAYKSCIDLPIISRALGHTSTNTTMTYIKEIEHSKLWEANKRLLHTFEE